MEQKLYSDSSSLYKRHKEDSVSSHLSEWQSKYC